MYLRTVFGGHNLTAAQENYLIRIKCAIILYVINVLYWNFFKNIRVQWDANFHCYLDLKL